ncbi:ATP-dependent RecD-like DNA helicase [Campylobacter sp. VBCF_05 NA6]|uniref:ATP-dependent DNA helicase n=1 Tax=unclassified Campylobacter TaxID=2593542 RepID=UPI0022EA0633|nr:MULTISPECIES: ATP-dependent RecD-like DNA helicase [unclassified Campylobacter]MDA3058273.1 ATP-dependent RecD-like DNA helicase [Campylobacter sp. VBCF_04 NA7]MDA3059843.1 ATP-dependent RecD-like DNA helicase [Campylobacter sp. VBCF_05 NA6]
MENLEIINAEIEKLIDENSSSQEDFLKKMQELFRACLKHITGKKFNIDFYEALPEKLQKDFRFLKTLYMYYLGSYKYDKKFDEEDTDAAAIEANAYGEKDESKGDANENKSNDIKSYIAKIYPQLIEFKNLLKDKCDINILNNIEILKPKINKNLQKYYESVFEKLQIPSKIKTGRQYYLTKQKAIVLNNNKIIYEISLVKATDGASKFNRFIAFSKDRINDNYALNIALRADSVEVNGKSMPIFVVVWHKVAIRTCEFNNFIRLFGLGLKIDKKEKNRINNYMTEYGVSLFDIIKFSDTKYNEFANIIEYGNVGKSRKIDDLNFIKPILEKCREKINRMTYYYEEEKEKAKLKTGEKIMLSYLLYTMKNKVLKNQRDDRGEKIKKMTIFDNIFHEIKFDYFNLVYFNSDSLPFRLAPFCMNPAGQGSETRLIDLLQCLISGGREDEFLYNRLLENTEKFGKLYTNEKCLQDFLDEKDVQNFTKWNLKYLEEKFNKKELFEKIDHYNGSYFIVSKEDEIVEIITKLQEKVKQGGISDYTQKATKWLKLHKEELDEKDENGNKKCSDEKQEIIKYLFDKSKVVFIYGSAGTGKSELMKHISNLHSDEKQIFLAHTASAVQNLRDRIPKAKNNARTLKSFLYKYRYRYIPEYFDIIFIDECSMVSNYDMLEFLNKNAFKKLVLVGDDYQIDAIQYGSWFDMVKIFLPILKKDKIRKDKFSQKNSVCQFELTKTFRVEIGSEELLDFYKDVREAKTEQAKTKQPKRDILKASLNGSGKYSKYFFDLDKSRDKIFEKQDELDEILLCLNYDGLDGINNMNMFLQVKNQGKSCKIGVLEFKEGDPVVFVSGNRFLKNEENEDILHNNLKGKIVKISELSNKICFDIEVNKIFENKQVGKILSKAKIEYNQWDEKDKLKLLEIKEKTSVIRFYEPKKTKVDKDGGGDMPFALAYAISIHKSQGLEYDKVKIVIPDEAKNLITHNIFYTAITRAKKYLEIYCSKETMEHIIDNFGRDSIKADAAMLINRGKLEFCY